MFRVLITDASSKHCLPLQRHIRRELPDVELVGHDMHFYPLCKHYGYLHSLIRRVPLEKVLHERDFDMILPVGAKAVATVARCRPELAALPSPESLTCCFDKSATLSLAQRLDVPTPLTFHVMSLTDLADCPVPYPCVIKPVCETEAKGVLYAFNNEQREKCVHQMFAQIRVPPGRGVLIQQYISGEGAGFFALFDHGKPVRIFMHRRLREYPITGGASSAACAHYDEVLKDYGLRLLKELNWHGVAMVEFKHEAGTGRYVLMEINPKFWGSVELALEAGVNFGADLIRVYRQEPLQYSEAYDRLLHFYWPLDGDLIHLFRTSQLKRIQDYFATYARTNLGYSRVADVVKTGKAFLTLMRG